MESPTSRPVNIRSRSPGASLAAGSPLPASHSRHATMARLSSPVPSSRLNTPPVQQVPTPQQIAADNKDSELPKLDSAGSLPGPGHSALSLALAGSSNRTPP